MILVSLIAEKVFCTPSFPLVSSQHITITWNFSAIHISNIYSLPFSLSSPFGIPIMCMLYFCIWQCLDIVFSLFSVFQNLFAFQFGSFYWHIFKFSSSFLGWYSLLRSPSKEFFSFLWQDFWFLVFPLDSFLELPSLSLHYSLVLTHCLFIPWETLTYKL